MSPVQVRLGPPLKITNLDTIKVSRFFLFIEVQVPPLHLLFALCGLFFLFKAMFFKTKLINEHVWSFNLLTIPLTF